MIELISVTVFILLPIVLLAVLPPPYWVRRPRGFSMRGEFGSRTPFRQRPDGTWYNSETGENLKRVTFKELLKKQ